MKILDTIMDSFFGDPDEPHPVKGKNETDDEERPEGEKATERKGELPKQPEKLEPAGDLHPQDRLEGGDRGAEEVPSMIAERETRALLYKDKEAALKLAGYYFERDKKRAAFWYHYAFTHRDVYPLIHSQIQSIFGAPQYSPEKLKEAKKIYSEHQYQRMVQWVHKIEKDIEEMELMIQNTGDLSVIIELGMKYESLGNYKEALRHYFVAMDAGFVDAYLRIACVYMQLNDFFNGMQWLEKAVQYTSFSALGYLARIYEEMEDHEQMMQCYLRMAELGDMLVCQKIARLYMDEMELSKAVEYFQEALKYMEGKAVQMGCETVEDGPVQRDVSQVLTQLKKLENLLSLSPNPVERLEKIFNDYSTYSRRAAIKLGGIFYLGIGVEKNEETAAYWYNQAACR